MLVIWLSLMLVLAATQPAFTHEFKIEEPDYPLQWAAVVLFPVGHVLHHLIFGNTHAAGTPPAVTQDRNEEVEQAPGPRYNFSPRKKSRTDESRQADG
jgi:hypothetical protein